MLSGQEPTRTYGWQRTSGYWNPTRRERGACPLSLLTYLGGSAELVTRNKDALLIFTGGQTKSASTTTEAESYLRLALSSNVFGASKSPGKKHHRATTENYALDSYQNLLFSIARFREYTGNFPESITVVGYEFKRKRYVELHRAAIRWPLRQFQYIGVDAEDEQSLTAQQGELNNGYNPYSRDLYGCHSFLTSKRRLRNPHFRYHPYHSSNPELMVLFNWCPGNADSNSSAIFPGSLPWSNV
ncbi:hypothetical protein APHAL10511_000145 [Amanita phalloides]|nr:hypothetical protein APHAL10511_000145 [Amanita phalloides]